MNYRIEQIIKERKENVQKRRLADTSPKIKKTTTNVLQDQLYNTIMHANEKYRRGGSISKDIKIKEDPHEIESFHLRQLSNIRGNPWRNLPIKIKMECLREYLDNNVLLDPDTQEQVVINLELFSKIKVQYSTQFQKIVRVTLY